MKIILLILCLQLFASNVLLGASGAALPVAVAVDAAPQVQEQQVVKAHASKNKVRLRKVAKAKGDNLKSFILGFSLFMMSVGLFAGLLGIILKLAAVSWVTWGMVALAFGFTLFFALIALTAFIFAYTSGSEQMCSN